MPGTDVAGEVRGAASLAGSARHGDRHHRQALTIEGGGQVGRPVDDLIDVMLRDVAGDSPLRVGHDEGGLRAADHGQP